MSIQHRKTLIATVVVALVGAPVWAAAAGEYSETGRSAEQMRGASTGELTSMTPNELQGKRVVTAEGEKVGTVKSIVSSKLDNKPYAVISSGGFLGIGDKEVAVSLDKLSMSGDQLQVQETKDELKASPEYTHDEYVNVEPQDQPISEFSAFEAEHPGAQQGEPGRMQESPSGTEAPSSEQGRSSEMPPEQGQRNQSE